MNSQITTFKESFYEYVVGITNASESMRFKGLPEDYDCFGNLLAIAVDNYNVSATDPKQHEINSFTDIEISKSILINQLNNN